MIKVTTRRVINQPYQNQFGLNQSYQTNIVDDFKDATDFGMSDDGAGQGDLLIHQGDKVIAVYPKGEWIKVELV